MKTKCYSFTYRLKIDNCYLTAISGLFTITRRYHEFRNIFIEFIWGLRMLSITATRIRAPEQATIHVFGIHCHALT